MRPITTMFLLMSVDGKISTGNSDMWDFDSDLPRVPLVAEGLHQYYDIEKQGDPWSFITGHVLAKVGWNTREVNPDLKGVSFMIWDSNSLTSKGLANLSRSCDKIFVVTTNENHPAINMQSSNIFCEKINGVLQLTTMFEKAREKFGIERMTLQSGGNMNRLLFTLGLVDYLHLVVAPVIVGGKDVSTLVDGLSIKTLQELNTLTLEKVNILSHSYLDIKYKVNEEQA